MSKERATSTRVQLNLSTNSLVWIRRARNRRRGPHGLARGGEVFPWPGEYSLVTASTFPYQTPWCSPFRRGVPQASLLRTLRGCARAGSGRSLLKCLTLLRLRSTKGGRTLPVAPLVPPAERVRPPKSRVSTSLLRRFFILIIARHPRVEVSSHSTSGTQTQKRIKDKVERIKFLGMDPQSGFV